MHLVRLCPSLPPTKTAALSSPFLADAVRQLQQLLKRAVPPINDATMKKTLDPHDSLQSALLFQDVCMCLP